MIMLLTRPPDFNELTGDSKTNFSYTDFLESFAKGVKLHKGNFASICISDRKSGGQVHIKTFNGIDVFKSLRLEFTHT